MGHRAQYLYRVPLHLLTLVGMERENATTVKILDESDVNWGTWKVYYEAAKERKGLGNVIRGGVMCQWRAKTAHAKTAMKDWIATRKANERDVEHCVSVAYRPG